MILGISPIDRTQMGSHCLSALFQVHRIDLLPNLGTSLEQLHGRIFGGRQTSSSLTRLNTLDQKSTRTYISACTTVTACSREGTYQNRPAGNKELEIITIVSINLDKSASPLKSTSSPSPPSCTRQRYRLAASPLDTRQLPLLVGLLSSLDSTTPSSRLLVNSQGINLSSGSTPPLFPSFASIHNFLYLPKCHNVNPNKRKKPTKTGMNVRPV